MKKIRRTPNKQQPESIGQNILVIIKSSIIAVIITLICFAIFAIVIKVADMQETVIPPVVQVVRTLSMAFGGMLAARTNKKMGWVKGGITGLLYIIWAVIISSLFGGTMFKAHLLFSDMALGIIAGAVGGIIGVNI